MDRTTIGLAGEFFVMGELLRRGYRASLTFGNTKTIDIHVSNDTGKTLRFQVKTKSAKPTRTGHSKWTIGSKSWQVDRGEQQRLFYVFVLLPPGGMPPKYYIARAEDVVSQTKDDFFRREREIKSGKREYRGNIKTEQERLAFPMKDFNSERFVNDGFRFLGWDELFDLM